MGSEEVLVRTKWHNARRINIIMRDVIVAFDVIEIDSVGNSFMLIQLFEISKQIGIIHDASDVTFKVSMFWSPTTPAPSHAIENQDWLRCRLHSKTEIH